MTEMFGTKDHTGVIPVLVTGIQPAASSGAS